MKPHQITQLLLALNVVFFISISAQQREQKFEKISVKEFELVGDRGERRASIKVEPGGDVLLRLMDDTGTIRVKIGAGQDGSGLVLLDGSTEPGLQALAKKDGGKITLQNKQGKRDL